MESKIVKAEDAVKASTEYFNGDEFAATTWINKYALKDGDNNLLELTPDDMHKRLAREIARIERQYPNPLSEDELYEVMKNFKYIIPQGGPMTSIGDNYRFQSLSNCFVIGVEEGSSDSYGAIFRMDEEQTQLCKRRGGVGHDLSDLRPEGALVTNAAGTSSGVVSFMERYSNSTREVAQMGRRGALMLSISVQHPDAEKFIDAKLEDGKVTGANISVKLTDEFMNAVLHEQPFTQRFPINSDLPWLESKCVLSQNILYKSKDNKESARIINAKKLWDKIIHNAWKSAEPGVLFWDTIIRESPADCYSQYGYRTVSTNPCGEIPLCPYDSCRLLAINLYSYVKNPFTSNAKFDEKLFIKHARIAQRMMDDIIDLEVEKIDAILNKIENDPESDDIKSVEKNLWLKIRKKTIEGRRTGVGITAEGDMLAALGLRYGSDEAIELATSVHKLLAVNCYTSSIYLAKERGCFKIWNEELESENPFIKRVLENVSEDVLNIYHQYGRRNISCLTIAPTGTTSIMSQTTSGIEPVFLPTYKRRRKTADKSKAVFIDNVGDMFEEYRVFHHKFIEWFYVGVKNLSKSVDTPIGRWCKEHPQKCEPMSSNEKPEFTFQRAKIILEKLSDEAMDSLYKISPYYLSTANDCDWVSKVNMQGSIQKWVDHSISCTVNLPSNVTEELVSDVYMAAYKSGCKGCTVYRDGSRSGVLVKTEKTVEEKRPEILDAKVVRFKNGSENWIAFVGLLNNKPYEIFTGKVDDDIKFLPKSITEGKIVQVKDEDSEKHRYDFRYEIGYGYKNTLPGISLVFNPEYWNYARLISGMMRANVTLPKIIKVVDGMDNGDLINTWKKGVSRALRQFVADGTKSGSKCPKCGADLIFESGCVICPGCGDSKCG